MEQEQHYQEKDSRRPTIFSMVSSSILGAVIGSVPGVLMSSLGRKGGQVNKWGDHVMMMGGMIGMMVGHDILHWKSPAQQETKGDRGR